MSCREGTRKLGRIRVTVLALIMLFTATHNIAADPSADQSVVVEGLVLHPGEHQIQPETRLSQVAQAAGVKSDAYFIGATWLSRKHVAAQRGLKAGLLFDLRTVQQDALINNAETLIALTARLIERVRALPVTGRRLGTLDPVRLEVEPRSNRLIEPGDRLRYPARPDTVTVTGAVAADCIVPFAGLRPGAEYVADCPLHPDADRDWLYLIQPDGHVSRRGVAGWNRESAQPLAPGAMVYVPLRTALLKGRAEELNDDFAAFLATQPLPLAEEAR